MVKCGSKKASVVEKVQASEVISEEKAESEPCSICLNAPKRRGILECSHKFCFDCIFQWSQNENTCPLCKERFESIEDPDEEAEEQSRPKKGKGKRTAAKKKKIVKVPRRDQRLTRLNIPSEVFNLGMLTIGGEVSYVNSYISPAGIFPDSDESWSESDEIGIVQRDQSLREPLSSYVTSAMRLSRRLRAPERFTQHFLRFIAGSTGLALQYRRQQNPSARGVVIFGSDSGTSDGSENGRRVITRSQTGLTSEDSINESRMQTRRQTGNMPENQSRQNVNANTVIEVINLSESDGTGLHEEIRTDSARPARTPRHSTPSTGLRRSQRLR